MGGHGEMRFSPYTLSVIQTAIAFCNFTLLLLLLIMGATYGVRIQNHVKVYWDAANVDPPMVRHMVNQTTGIIDNVFQLSANMVPISRRAADAMVNGTDTTGNITLAQASTNAIAGLGRADWRAAVGNASLMMGSVSAMNFSKVSDLVGQVNSPATQAWAKESLLHMLGSFDFVSGGAASVLETFKAGLFKAEHEQLQSDKPVPAQLCECNQGVSNCVPSTSEEHGQPCGAPADETNLAAGFGGI